MASFGRFASPVFRAARATMSRGFHTGMGSSSIGARSAMRSAKVAPMITTQKRFLNLHEYQSKGLMAKYDVRVQKGATADTPEEALKVATDIKEGGAVDLILKAQIHAGGRGKGHFDTGFKGGVKICSEPTEVGDFSKEMFGNNLITPQTGPEGQPVKKVLVHEGVDFDNEYYFALLLDRSANGPVIVASSEGGMDIEEVFAKNPEAIKSMPVDIHEGVQQHHIDAVSKLFGFTGAVAEDAGVQIRNMYKLFLETDATQVEINPFVLTKDGKIFCVDAKINFDENAAYRQKEVFAMRDTSMEDPREVEASKNGLNYVGLDGNIGCMVNGAGLAMATMDIIALHGAMPANFLDVGGGANEEQVEEAFKLLSGDSRVKAILVNIFGGIMKCDTIATGIVNAAKKIGLKLPLVVRLEGTNVEQGVKILKDSGLDLITATDLDDAAKKAVKAIE